MLEHIVNNTMLFTPTLTSERTTLSVLSKKPFLV